MRRPLGALCGVLAAVLLVAGCGSLPFAPGPSPQLNSPQPAPLPSTAKPTGIDVPSIKAHSSLIPLGIQGMGGVPVTPPSKAGEAQVPDVHHPQQAGWIQVANKDTPVANDPLVILGHVDGNSQHGVFFDLKNIEIGAKVHISRDDGTTSTYTVTKFRQIKKTNFPTQDVYGPAVGNQIRLVTCGGDYDAVHRNYLDSEIAYGTEDPAPTN
ncbi:MAG: class sortase [Streptosporangiaceae bacterium]|nr:class sortase [Streptosporangiaceae bacterium]